MAKIEVEKILDTHLLLLFIFVFLFFSLIFSSTSIFFFFLLTQTPLILLILFSNRQFKNLLTFMIFLILLIIIFLISLLIFTNISITVLFVVIIPFLFFIKVLFAFITGNRKFRDFLGTKFMLIVTVFVSILFFLIFLTLIIKSGLILENYSITDLLFSSNWNPGRGEFGLFAIIIGTLLVTLFALVIAIPISLLSAVYITEYAPKHVRRVIRPFLDVLAGVPSVVYGLCSFLFLVPLVRDVIAPAFGVESTGLCLFSASVTLAVMVFPIIISLCVEAFSAIPLELKEASLCLGSTKWETVKKVIFRASAPSIISAVLLGFGRAFGETIAVTMVCGGLPKIPSSIFGPVQTLPSLMASSYGELMSVPIRESALMFVALILFIVVLVFNLLGFLVLRRAKKRWAT